MNTIITQTDSDYIEKVEKAMQSYTLMSIIIIAVIAGVILALVFTLYILHKNGSNPMRRIRTYDHYKKAKGKITSLEEETYFINPYVHQPQLITEDDKKKKNKMSSAIEKQIAEDAVKEQSKPVEKHRIKAGYTFAAEGLGDGFYGEFYIYDDNESISLGDMIEVMYDPERPQINFTEQSKPV